MNLQDRFFEMFLATLDRILDGITFGAWTRLRGNVVPNVRVRKRP